MTATICAIIVNYRTPELTARAATSVLASARHYNGPVRVVVVDNSADGASERLRELCPGCDVVVMNNNRGFAAGVNFGIATGNEDLIALVNSDAVVEEAFLHELAVPFADPHVGATTALLLLEGRYRQSGDTWVHDEDGVILVNSTGNITDRSGNGMDRDWQRPLGSWHADSHVEGFGGGAAMIRREALNGVGLFREDFFLYYEDTELSLRLRRAGWDIRYVETAIAWHRHGASTGDGSDLHVYCNTRNRLIVARELGMPTAAIAWLRSIARGLHPKARVVRSAMGDALRGRFRPPAS